MGKEIALSRSYGGFAYPKEIKEDIKGKTFIEVRSQILPNYIKTLKSLNEKELEKKIFEMVRGDVIRYKNTIVIAEDDGYGNLVRYTCEVVKVDTSKKWTVSDYDGSEYIEYLDYKLEDKEMNYWVKK